MLEKVGSFSGLAALWSVWALNLQWSFGTSRCSFQLCCKSLRRILDKYSGWGPHISQGFVLTIFPGLNDYLF